MTVTDGVSVFLTCQEKRKVTKEERKATREESPEGGERLFSLCG